MDVDLAVIGGGAAGLGAARAGVRAGKRTAMLVEGPVGGDCTFTGCVPSKTLIEHAASGKSFGEAMTAVRDAVARIAATETAEALTREGVTVLQGRATFTDYDRMTVGGERVRAERTVIATGARPVIPGALSGLEVLTSETVWDLEEAPQALTIVGGGSIGCELAQAFARFGVQVTLLEGGPRLLPVEEPEASAVVLAALWGDGVDVRLNARVIGHEGGRPRLESGDVPPGTVLVAAGRAPDTSGLGLAAAGVDTDGKGRIVTDDRLRTSAPGVYAAGDVTGRLPFTHAADAMGRLAAGNAFARIGSRFETAAIPWVTFTDPEVARVGMREDEAAAHGGEVAELPMADVDRAIAAGRTEGFVKLIAGPRTGTGRIGGGKILGATVVAPRAGEMIAEIALAMHLGAFTGRLAQAVHAYPTWSSATQLAAAQFFFEVGGRRARPAQP